MYARYLFIFAMLSQLAAPLFAECIGYSDSFDVRVMDAKLRPIEGAEITVNFDRGTSFGEQYFTTQPKYTNAQGVVRFDILNQGTTTREIDCTITINGSAGGSVGEITVQANTHGSPVDVILTDVYPLMFYVRNQARVPIANAVVTIGNTTGRTNSDGMIKNNYKTGNYSYFANYLDAQQAGTLEVVNDTSFEVIFAHYAISIDVVDDASKPLNVTLAISNRTLNLPDGHFEQGRIFGEQIPYSVDYLGIVREGVLTPATEPSITLRYDTHAPFFGEITPGNSSGRTQLVIKTSDPNEYASGIDVSSMKVSYRVEPSDETTPWSSAVTFTSGRNEFTAQFPELPADSIVKFRIEVKDMEGNRADIDGKFSTLPVQITQNTTQNQTIPPEKPEESQGIPFYYIIIGVIVLILAVYMAIRLKPKAPGSSEKELAL